jgi:hypothetical protein
VLGVVAAHQLHAVQLLFMKLSGRVPVLARLTPYGEFGDGSSKHQDRAASFAEVLAARGAICTALLLTAWQVSSLCSSRQDSSAEARTAAQ